MVGTVSAPTGDPVVCHGVDTGNVEMPGMWMVVGGVPLEVPSGAVTDRAKAEEKAVFPGFTVLRS